MIKVMNSLDTRSLKGLSVHYGRLMSNSMIAYMLRSSVFEFRVIQPMYMTKINPNNLLLFLWGQRRRPAREEILPVMFVGTSPTLYQSFPGCTCRVDLRNVHA